MTNKVCRCCNKTLVNKPKGQGNICKDCYRIESKKRRNKTGRQVINKIAYRSTLKNKYGMTEKDYADMYNSQSGKCAICRISYSLDSRDLHVDHCHITGKIRGLLCLKCNLGLGKFYDNSDLLLAAASYLRFS